METVTNAAGELLFLRAASLFQAAAVLLLVGIESRLKPLLLVLQDCAGVILYCAENATQVALDGIQCLGK